MLEPACGAKPLRTERAAREREQRLARALATFDKIEKSALDKKKDKASARAKRGKAAHKRAGETPVDEDCKARGLGMST